MGQFNMEQLEEALARNLTDMDFLMANPSNPSFFVHHAQLKKDIDVMQDALDIMHADAAAAAAEAAAATAAAIERDAGVQRAILRHELMARYKTNGLAYLLTAREAEDPMQMLEAANMAVFSFEQYKKISVTRSLREEVSEAHSLAAAAQKELDKPFYVKLFDYALELLVTG